MTNPPSPLLAPPVPLALDGHRLHLWHAAVDSQLPDARAARYRALLTPAEAAQHLRFYFDKDQRRYLVTRALVRDVLSRYVPAIAPDAWRFEPNAWGCPKVVNDNVAAQQLRFNLSHASTAVVLAVSFGREVGVDIESTQRKAPLDVADQYFSRDESAQLRALPLADQALRFWELWTLKESYIKARGMGLSIPLDQFSFQLDSPGRVTLALAPGLDDRADRWQCWQLRPDDEHLVAVCVERHPEGQAQELQLESRRIVPLEHDAPIFPVVSRRPL
ncbi:MAG: hypothetical protein RLZZ618_1525 [Pseudomonadota bacterium]|jgi:4'-phosphopantetheinyl transferase